MKFITATNPSYADATWQAINLWVTFKEFSQPIPFTASLRDIEPHGREIYLKAINGEFGPIAPYIP